MVNLPGVPLQFVSLRSTTGDFLATVTLKNISAKSITGYQLGVIIAAPEACVADEAFGPLIRLPADRVNVAPAATVSTSNYRLDPAAVLQFGRARNSRAVITQLAVLRVTYSDGSTWSYQSTGPIFDLQQLNAQAALECKP